MKAEMEMSAVGKIILFTILIVIILGLLIIIISNFSTKETCKFSARLQISTSVGGLNSPFDLVCPRKFITVEDDRTKRSDFDLLLKVGKETEYSYLVTEKDFDTGKISDPKPKHLVSKDSELFKEELTQIFSYELGECWDTFLHGGKDFLEAESKFRDVNTCVICSEIYIDREPFTEFNLNLGNYLKQNPHHFYNTSDAETYDEILYTDRTPSISQLCKSELFPEDHISINNQESYAVILVRAGGDTWGRIRSFASRTLGTNPDGSDFCQAVWVMPVSDIVKNCHALVN